MTRVHDFTVRDPDGNPVELAAYRDKILLIVNTASFCGKTPQYKGLEELYRRHRAQGFEILGFPCNQFGRQEPGDAQQIGKFCRDNYGISFPMFAKIDVNGAHADPLFVYLRKQAPGILGTTSIKWNFTKFLVDWDGMVVRRYPPGLTPERIEPDVLKLLAR